MSAAAAGPLQLTVASARNWAPPSVLVDAIGATRTITLLERARLPVPAAVVEAARHHRAMFKEPMVDSARFFAVAA